MSDFTCSVCRQRLPVSERSGWGGAQPRCKRCRNAQDRAAYREGHPRRPLRTNLAGAGREEMAWLAGLVEGEGSFFQTHSVYMGMKVEMVDADVVRRCLDITGVGVFRLAKAAKNGHQASYAWSVTDSATTYALMVALWPWLGERRRRRITDMARTWLAVPRVMPAHVRRTGRPLAR